MNDGLQYLEDRRWQSAIDAFTALIAGDRDAAPPAAFTNRAIAFERLERLKEVRVHSHFTLEPAYLWLLCGVV